MALFFDTEWFDAAVAKAGLSRAILAQALGLSEAQLGDVWKDQRELSVHEVAILAVLLAAAPEEIARHAGISTPVPRAQSNPDEVNQRLARIEAALAELTALVKARS
ncbi:MAG TPA: hypothetical protein VGF56_04055 [Rhizomicrobium sp.]|jgi:hypothetical protein